MKAGSEKKKIDWIFWSASVLLDNFIVGVHHYINLKYIVWRTHTCESGQIKCSNFHNVFVKSSTKEDKYALMVFDTTSLLIAFFVYSFVTYSFLVYNNHQSNYQVINNMNIQHVHLHNLNNFNFYR